jgi:hypothetical protein
VPTRTTVTVIATYPTPPTATVVGTYVNLFATEKIYGELINWALPLGFGFRAAENLICYPPPVVFTTVPPNVQITVDPVGTPKTTLYTIPGSA